MTKEQAASQLGISVRTLQRLMTAGQIQYSTTRNPHGGSVAIFDEAEVERIRKDRDASPVVHHPVTALAALNGNGHAMTRSDPMMADLGQAIAKAIKPAVPIDQRVWLTRDQAVELCGIPKGLVYASAKASCGQSSRVAGIESNVMIW